VWADCCEYVNEPSRFKNVKEYLDHMGEYQILKNSAPPSCIYTNFTWSGHRKTSNSAVKERIMISRDAEI